MLRLEWERAGERTVLWRDDRECSQYSVQFLLSQSLPPRALVSYPGSGNTWTRYLVEAATGVFTGSVYSDPGIYTAGHLGERREYSDGSTLLQKTHHSAVGESHNSLTWRRHHIKQFGGRAVLVIRNPYKAILSYWNLLQTGSQTKTADSGTLKGKKFKLFVADGAGRWLDLIQGSTG